MSREMTNKEAIANLNHIYGMVSPDIQRSLDVAIKALEERPQGEVKKMENDLISRSALKASIPEPSNITQRMVYRTLCNLIDNAPTVEPLKIYEFKGCDNCELERAQGEWIKISENGLAYKCNKCGEVDIFPKYFCPNCGADMRKLNCVRCDHFGKGCEKCEKGEEE